MYNTILGASPPGERQEFYYATTISMEAGLQASTLGMLLGNAAAGSAIIESMSISRAAGSLRKPLCALDAAMDRKRRLALVDPGG